MAVSSLLQGDLFADAGSPALVTPYAAAFEAWQHAELQAGHLRRDASSEVYAHMWTALSAWAVGQGIAIDRLDADDLQAYLASRGTSEELTPRYALRLLQLVHRVLGHRARRGEGLPSPSTPAAELLHRRPDLRFAGAADQDPLPDYLDATEARRLVAALSAVRDGRGPASRPWQDVRNAASVAVMLGAGLTPGEVRALTLADPVVAGGRVADQPWKLRVPASGRTPEREAPLAAWAGRVLAYWIDVRHRLAIPGPMLFPSTRSSGKPWGKVSQYEATHAVLRAAGIEPAEGGSYRLRHTFAMRQLRRGRPPHEVARWLGVTEPGVMARYLRTLPGPVDVV